MSYDKAKRAEAIYRGRIDDGLDLMSDDQIADLVKASEIVVCGWTEGRDTVSAIFVKGDYIDRGRYDVKTQPTKEEDRRSYRAPGVIHCASAADAARIQKMIKHLPK